jgi:Ferredoxin-like domain in Api92-like protein
MPNHVSNRLTLQCDDETAGKVFAEIGGTWEDGTGKPFDFDKLIPYPERFAKADKERQEWEKANPGASWANAPKDGFNQGGYEWCRDNWGTKWNAYSQKRLSDTELHFDTAWSAARPIFAALSARFPDLAFMVEYADEDIGRNAGVLRYRNGLQGEADLDGTEAARLWFQINPDSDPKEYGYDPVTFERLNEEEAA